MTSGFKELEGITADAGIEAWGKNTVEAFIGAAEGMASLIARIPDDRLTRTEPISVHGENLPSLLVQFLNQLIYLEETQDLLPGKIRKLWINGPDLFAIVRCAESKAVNPSERRSVKAATYHGLEIEESEDKVRVKVIFDI